MNIGNFSRSFYDDCYFEDRTQQMTDPLNYRLSIDQIYNSDRCFSKYGPRNATYGNSTIGEPGYAVSQNQVEIESYLTNRNVKATKCKSSDMVNPINPVNMKPTLATMCNNKLKPHHTRLSHSAKNYRGMGISRFYDTIHNPQDNIFYNFERNTTLEARDNYTPINPKPWSQISGLPVESQDGYKKCSMQCNSTCPTAWTLK